MWVAVPYTTVSSRLNRTRINSVPSRERAKARSGMGADKDATGDGLKTAAPRRRRHRQLVDLRQPDF
jgi:hypothetical protein